MTLRSKRPIVSMRCPANAYAAVDERIIECAFPRAVPIGTQDGTKLPGGLISFKYSGGTGARVEIYRAEGLTIVVPPRLLWAAWCRPYGGDADISLFGTQREALEHCADLLEVRTTDPGAGGEGTRVLDDDELTEALNDAMNEENKGDWDVAQVMTP